MAPSSSYSRTKQRNYDSVYGSVYGKDDLVFLIPKEITEVIFARYVWLRECDFAGALPVGHERLYDGAGDDTEFSGDVPPWCIG